MPTLDVVVEIRRSLLCPERHWPHYGLGPLLPPLCLHSYTAQLLPVDPPEAATSVVPLSQLKPPMQWRGYKPIILSLEGVSAKLIHSSYFQFYILSFNLVFKQFLRVVRAVHFFTIKL